jgi:hypothetical protein
MPDLSWHSRSEQQFVLTRLEEARARDDRASDRGATDIAPDPEAKDM